MWYTTNLAITFWHIHHECDTFYSTSTKNKFVVYLETCNPVYFTDWVFYDFFYKIMCSRVFSIRNTTKPSHISINDNLLFKTIIAQKKHFFIFFSLTNQKRMLKESIPLNRSYLRSTLRYVNFYKNIPKSVYDAMAVPLWALQWILELRQVSRQRYLSCCVKDRAIFSYAVSLLRIRKKELRAFKKNHTCFGIYASATIRKMCKPKHYTKT